MLFSFLSAEPGKITCPHVNLGIAMENTER